MSSYEEAKAAVEALDGLEVAGRSMNVDFALTKEESRDRPKREPRAPRAPRADTTGRRVYVGNLGYATTDGTF
jgi:RNA recognition motif-containing protein